MDSTRDTDPTFKNVDANNTDMQISAEEQPSARADEMCIDQQSNSTAQLDQLPTVPVPMVQDGSDSHNLHRRRSPSPSSPTIPCKRKSRPVNFHQGNKWPLETRPRKMLAMHKETSDSQDSGGSGNRGAAILDLSARVANVSSSATTTTGNSGGGSIITIAGHGDGASGVGIPSDNNLDNDNTIICTALSGEPTLDNSRTNATTPATNGIATNDIGFNPRATSAVPFGDPTVSTITHLDACDPSSGGSIIDIVNHGDYTSSGVDSSIETASAPSRGDVGVESESEGPNITDQRGKCLTGDNNAVFGDSIPGSVLIGSSMLPEGSRNDTGVESNFQGLTHESSRRPEQPGLATAASGHIADRSRASSGAQACDTFHVDAVQSYERQSDTDSSSPSSNADFSTPPKSARGNSSEIPSLPHDVIANEIGHDIINLAESSPEDSVDGGKIMASDEHAIEIQPLGLDQGFPAAGSSSNESAPVGRLLETQHVMNTSEPASAPLVAHSSREDSLPAAENELSTPLTTEWPTRTPSGMTANLEEAGEPPAQVREYSASPVIPDNESVGSHVQPQPIPRPDNVFMFPSVINENASYNQAIANVQPFSPPVLQGEPHAMDEIPLEELARKIKPRNTFIEAPVAPKNVVEIGGYGLRSTKNRLDAAGQSHHISAKKQSIRGRKAKSGKNLTKSFSAPELDPVKIPEGMAFPTNRAFDFQFPSSSAGEGSRQAASNHRVDPDIVMELPNEKEPNETSATRSSPRHGLNDAPMRRNTRGAALSANGSSPVTTGAPATIDTGSSTQGAAIKQSSATTTLFAANIATISKSKQTMVGGNAPASSSHAGPSNVQTPPNRVSFEEPEFGNRHSSYLNMEDILPVSVDEPQNVSTRAQPLRADSSQASLSTPGRKRKSNDKGKNKGKQKQKATQYAVTVEEVPDESIIIDTDPLEHDIHNFSGNSVADATKDAPPQNAPSTQTLPTRHAVTIEEVPDESIVIDTDPLEHDIHNISSNSVADATKDAPPQNAPSTQTLPESQQPATKGDIARLDLQVSKLNTFAEFILLRERESIDRGFGPRPSGQASHTTRDSPAGEWPRPEPQPEPSSTTNNAAYGDESSSRPWTRSQKKGTTLHGFQHATPDPKVRSPQKNNINACVRELTKTLLGYNDSDSPFPIPDLEKVQEFDETLDPEAGPSFKYFRCDIYGESFNSNWNLRLAEIFVEEWTAADEYPPLDDAVIEKAFLSHLKYLKDTKYKQTYQAHVGSPRSNTPRRKARSPREAKVYTRRTKRKTTLYDRREASAHYHAELVEFIYLLHRLSSKGMSDDESDHEHGTHNGGKLYKIIEPEWRAPFLKTVLRIMDLLYVPTKFDADGIPERGCWPRYRKPSSRTKKGKAIVGLPSNWYNQVWLDTLSKSARRELDIQPPVEIVISESVKREAARYLHIDAENHKPDDPDDVNLAELDHWLETGEVFTRD